MIFVVIVALPDIRKRWLEQISKSAERAFRYPEPTTVLHVSEVEPMPSICDKIDTALVAAIEDEAKAVDEYTALREDIKKSTVPHEVAEVMANLINTIITDEAKHKRALEKVRAETLKMCLTR